MNEVPLPAATMSRALVSQSESASGILPDWPAVTAVESSWSSWSWWGILVLAAYVVANIVRDAWRVWSMFNDIKGLLDVVRGLFVEVEKTSAGSTVTVSSTQTVSAPTTSASSAAPTTSASSAVSFTPSAPTIRERQVTFQQIWVCKSTLSSGKPVYHLYPECGTGAKVQLRVCGHCSYKYQKARSTA